MHSGRQEAVWESYTADVKVFASDRRGLLTDVSRVFADADITIRSLNTKVSKQGMATLEMMFEVSGRRQLKQLIEKIRQIESVIDVERSTG